MLPDRPETLSRSAEGEERMTLSAWVPPLSPARHPPPFTIHALHRVPPEYAVGERLPVSGFPPLRLSRGHHLGHDFEQPEYGMSYGLSLGGLDTEGLANEKRREPCSRSVFMLLKERYCPSDGVATGSMGICGQSSYNVATLWIIEEK